ncbi:MAG: LamG-like jellyroll fold domain-containing protein [Isosphaeraceae bacterium]
MIRRSFAVAAWCGILLSQATGAPAADAPAPGLRAGASTVDASPDRFPVIVNGGFLAARADRVRDPVRVKALVLDDGSTRLAIVVVDTCMMPRDLIDRAKAMARERTGIPVDRMLVSATHTHSAPSVMGALGTPADEAYAAILPARIAEAISHAAANLEPARAGWAAVDDAEHTHCRRWIRRPDRMLADPFGVKSVRANMHPGYQDPGAIVPSGPVDPALTVLALQSRSGRPIAVLANYSMHYYGAQPVSADYYGRFAAALARRIGAGGGVADASASDTDTHPFVAMMSQGTSGDQMWMDYGQPKKDPGLDAYADAVAASAERAYRKVEYREDVPLAMAESTLVLGRRLPDDARLAWAREVAAAMKDRKEPRTLPEVYAREAIYIHDDPRRELKLQAIRVGDLAIAAIPDEVYAITGLKLKARSPLPLTMNIELANGSEGYIPPPEQHELGGYTTWPARTAGLEVQAEPRIVGSVLKLLEQVAGRPSRPMPISSSTPYSEAVLASKPVACWRLDEIEGTIARDASGHGRDASYLGGHAFYLPGPPALGEAAKNRAVYLAGGSLKTPLDCLPAEATVEFWFRDGVPDAAGSAVKELTALGAEGIDPSAWHHVVLVRDGRGCRVMVDGRAASHREDGSSRALGLVRRFLGTRDAAGSGFEGLVDEVTVYDRTLTTDEVATHLRAATSR